MFSLIPTDFAPCATFRELVATYPHSNITVECLSKIEYDLAVQVFASPDAFDHDILIVDNSLLGIMADRPYLLELTEFLQEPRMNFGDFFENALSAYAEYPPNSRKYIAVPFFADAPVLVYRKDVFLQNNLQLPISLEDMADLAERLKSEFGFQEGLTAPWCMFSNCSSQLSVTMVAHQIIWSYGGDIWDSSSYRIKGILDSPVNVQAMELVKRLYRTASGLPNLNQITPLNNFCQGLSALAYSYLGAQDPLQCGSQAYNASDVGFYSVPYSRLMNGQAGPLGGFGMIVDKRANDIMAIKQLLQCLLDRDFQLRWIEAGYFTTRKSIVALPQFLEDSQGKVKEKNAVFLQGFPRGKSLWSVRSSLTIQPIHNAYLGAITMGQIPTADGLAMLASLEQQIMDQDYPCGAVCFQAFPRDESAYDAVLVLTALSLVIFCITLLWVLRSRNEPAVKQSSITFLLLILLGCCLLLVTPIINWKETPTDAMCIGAAWTFVLGVGFVFGAIICKTYRIQAIFFGRKLVTKNITDSRLLVYFAVIQLLCATFLSTWTVMSPPQVERPLILGSDGLPQFRNRCDTDTFAVYAVVVRLVAMLGASYMAYQVRKAPDGFHEAKYIGLAVYNWVFYSAFELVVNRSISDFNQYFSAKSVSLLLVANLTVGLIFVPKILNVYRGTEDLASIRHSKGLRWFDVLVWLSSNFLVIPFGIDVFSARQNRHWQQGGKAIQVMHIVSRGEFSVSSKRRDSESRTVVHNSPLSPLTIPPDIAETQSSLSPIPCVMPNAVPSPSTRLTPKAQTDLVTVIHQ